MRRAALGVDFARRARPVSLPGLALLALGLAVAAVAVTDHLAAREALGAAELQRDSLARRNARPALTARTPEEQAIAARVNKSAQRLAQRLSLPWPQLLGAVEAALDERVALLALEPDSQRAQLRLTGEAKSLPDALAFVARLEATGALARAHLAHVEARVSDGAPVLAITVLADWSVRP